MSPYEPYEPKLSLVIDRHDHSIFVAAHVEYNPATFENARGPERCLECLWRRVNGLFHMPIQFNKRRFCIDIGGLVFPEYS
jgi:hypothetical protein